MDVEKLMTLSFDPQVKKRSRVMNDVYWEKVKYKEVISCFVSTGVFCSIQRIQHFLFAFFPFLIINRG